MLCISPEKKKLVHFAESLARFSKYAKQRSKQSFDPQPSFQSCGSAPGVNNLCRNRYYLPSGDSGKKGGQGFKIDLITHSTHKNYLYLLLIYAKFTTNIQMMSEW